MGITSVPFLRRVLRQFVVSDMCKLDTLQPLAHDRTYFPSRRDIQNHVHKALVAGQFCGLDQDNLEKKVDEWRVSKPSDTFLLRKCTEAMDTHSKVTPTIVKSATAFPVDESDPSDIEDEEDEVYNSTFLFAHQTADQKKLLHKYGDMVLLDATYKTTKYALPLFMVVVRTNVSYVPIMEFICENESTPCITEALSLLKEWNPDWNPKFFMLDYSEQEFQALQCVFPDTEKYLCNFHVEQAWNRWTRETKNNLKDEEKQFLLATLRKIAQAPTAEMNDQAVDELRNSALYRENTKVQTYVETRWLNITKRWCVAYHEPGFHIGVTTNNGVEALNNSLKQFYLKLIGGGSLGSLVETLVCDFIPDHIMTYTRLNYMFSSQYKQYNEAIPSYLHNMPRTVVKHCLLKIAASSAFQKEDIDMVSDGLFSVKSESSTKLRYRVDLGALDRSPSCSCPSFTPSYLPCKHMFAVYGLTEYSWDNMSPLYRNSVYMSLDNDFLSKGAISPLGIDDDHTNTTPVPVLLSNHVEVPEPADSRQLEVCGKNLRESLKLLNDVSFLSRDETVLTEVNEVIVGLIDMVKRTAAMEDHLPLHQGHTAKRPTSTRQTRQLPSRKKRKKKLKRKYDRLCTSESRLPVVDVTPIQDETTGCLQTESRLPVVDVTPIQDESTGCLQTVLCPNCSQTYINTESFLGLSVSIKNTSIVNQALENFFAPVEHKRFHCRSCIKDVTAQGKVVLLTLPKVMAVHLKRFSNNGAKDRRPMKIEEEIGLRVFVKPGEVLEDKFRLIGVVMHDGIQQENGHYRCFTLHGMQWFEIDDMRVCPVPVRSVKEAQAYMLFYEAMPRCSLDT